MLGCFVFIIVFKNNGSSRWFLEGLNCVIDNFASPVNGGAFVGGAEEPRLVGTGRQINTAVEAGMEETAEELGEDQRVRLIVETVDDKAVDRAAALARLKAGIATMQFFSQGPLLSREELHDRS